MLCQSRSLRLRAGLSLNVAFEIFRLENKKNDFANKVCNVITLMTELCHGTHSYKLRARCFTIFQ